ncbi:hypothetical protein ACIRPH_19630 [Nocardiopsis sp. NPDC101807]|uniref:hypothetical protein n=1 Tax=Nocardiopsis sp. NPDC101807 TaxID=3364339 RepID=UPI003828F6D8
MSEYESKRIRVLGADFFAPGDLDIGGKAAPEMFSEVFMAAGPWWPTHPLVITDTDRRRLEELSWRVTEMILSAALRRARTAGELCTALGYSEALTPMLDTEEPLGRHLLSSVRPDLVLEEGVPRVLEVNIDGAVGGAVPLDQMGASFVDMYKGSTTAAADLSVTGYAVRRRFESIVEDLGLRPGHRLLVPAFSGGAIPGYEAAKRFAEAQGYMVPIARSMGIDLVFVSVDDLGIDHEDRLLAEGSPVDGVLRLFLSADQAETPGFTNLVRSVRAGRVGMFTSEAAWLLSNKHILHWLWEDIDRLPRGEQDFIRSFVPRTLPLTSDWLRSDAGASAIRDRGEWVVKPAGGSGGEGVVIGGQVDADAWRDALERGAGQDCVLQRKVAVDKVRVSFLHDLTRRTRNEEVPFLLGPLLFGGRGSGITARIGVPESSEVLNVHQGASIQSVLALREHGPQPRG